MSALGDTFRSAREAQGLTLADVADRIHIRSIYLAAIEADDWKAIGPPVYIRGFLRSYARCLGLDADAAVAQFAEHAQGSTPVKVSGAVPLVRNSPAGSESGAFAREQAAKGGFSVGAVVGVVVAFALVLFVGYEFVSFQREKAVVVPVAVPPPSTRSAVMREPPQRTAARQAKNEDSGFAVRLRDRSWLRVVVDGKVAMEGLYPKGTMRRFTGRSATVRVGNAGGVDVSVDGKDLGPMGGLGDVAERSFQLQ